MASLRYVREFDMFRKVQDHTTSEVEINDSLPSIALRSLSLVLIVVLGVYETWSFVTPIRKQRFDIDMTETSFGHDVQNSLQGEESLLAPVFPMDIGVPKKMRVMLDITVHGFPCIDLSLDYQDVMGTRNSDVSSTVFKERLHKNGTSLGDTLRNDPNRTTAGGASQPSLFKGNNSNSTCMSCYGALPDGECCNTCSDVLYAYRLKRWALPRIEEIEQCRHDGSAKSAYQPPQIIHLGDYSSEDYIPKFAKFSSLESSGREPRITTPFKLNLSLAPLKPLNTLVPGKSSSPFILNFSGLGGKRDFDDFDDLDDDWLDDMDGYGRKKDKDSTTKVLKWPSCMQRNVIIHGYDIGEALMIDLSKHGATSGCWNNDCTETDKFACETVETCAETCDKVNACRWWTFGDEDKTKKCWIRTGRHGREKRYGFSSGQKGCSPSANATDANTTSSNSSTNASVGSASAKNDTSANITAALDAKDTQTAKTQPRRMMSLEDKPISGPPRRLMGFEDDFGSPMRRPYALSFGPTPHMPIFGMGFDSRENQLRKEQRGESCRLHGYFDTNKVPGNFHIGTHGTMAPSYLSYFEEPAPTEQNMRHTINHLEFVDVATNHTLDVKQPLDGFESPIAFTFQYYISVNPATVFEEGGGIFPLEGYKFRAGSFVTNELIGPAVFFRFDIDPIRVTYYTQNVRWSSFLTNLCAVVGGVVALSTMLEKLLEAVLTVGE